MQIRTKLTLQFALIVAAILLVSVAFVYYSSAQYRQREFFDRLQAKASTTADLFINVQEVDSAMLRLFDENEQDILPNENITVYDNANRVVYTNNDTIDFHTTVGELDWIRSTGIVKKEYGNYEVIGMRYREQGGEFVVTAGAIDQYGKSKLANLKRVLIFVFIGGMLIISIAGWVYAGRALKPINVIVDKMNHISENNLHARLAVGNGQDEIARLSATFNAMLTRLEKAFRLQKTLVANVSHELKNPLTTITSQLEVALLRERDGAGYRKIIASVLDDIKSLNKAAIILLDLARLNAEEAPVELEPTRIDEILWSTREKLVAIHADYQIDLDLEFPDDDDGLVIDGNGHLLGIAFANLMDNGCKFSADRRIKVSMALAQAEMILRFEDHGIGIAASELADIFQPFFRGNNSSLAVGHGIGLSLVERILHFHHAKIEVTSEKNVGTTFTVTFPLSHS